MVISQPSYFLVQIVFLNLIQVFYIIPKITNVLDQFSPVMCVSRFGISQSASFKDLGSKFCQLHGFQGEKPLVVISYYHTFLTCSIFEVIMIYI